MLPRGKQMKPWTALAALIIVAALPARAQDAPPPRAELFAQIDALPMVAMCNTENALGYGFGKTDAPVSLLPMGLETRGLSPTALPFKRASLSNTKWSQRYIGATYSFDAGDKATALAAIQRVAEHFRKLGWIERKGGVEDDGPMIDFPPGPGEVAFYSAETARVGPGRKGIRASLTLLGSEVSFSCEDMAMWEVQFAEAFGTLPEGTPRPVAPESIRPEAINPQICVAAEGQAQIRAYAKTDDTDAMTRFLLERSNYAERLTTWKSDRLKKSGKVSDDRLLELALSGLQTGGDPLAGLAVVGEMLEMAEEITKQEKAGNSEAACRAGVRMLGSLQKIDKTVSAQWAAMNAALDAEAKKLGVSLD